MTSEEVIFCRVLLTEVALEQSGESLAMARLIAGHFVDGVIKA